MKNLLYSRFYHYSDHWLYYLLYHSLYYLFRHSLFLQVIYESGQEPFVFDHDCREGICGMCSLYIDGTPHGKTERGATTCQLYMRRFNDGDVITVEPWRSAGLTITTELRMTQKLLPIVKMLLNKKGD